MARNSNSKQSLTILLVGLLVIGGGLTLFKVQPRKLWQHWMPKAEMVNPTTPKTKVSSSVFYRTLGGEEKTKGQRNSPSQELGFTVELGVVRRESEARKMIDDFSKVGIEAYYTPLQQKGHVIFRVRRGVFDHEDAAEAERVSLETKNIKGAVRKL